MRQGKVLKLGRTRRGGIGGGGITGLLLTPFYSDLSLFLYHKEERQLKPYGKQFVKEKIYGLLGYLAANKGGKGTTFNA